MSFVIYDVETTGLRKRYDQIVSFAAVQTDNELNITDRFDISARVCGHVLPSPGAVHVTGVTPERLFDAALPSQFQAVAQIHDRLSSWSPALFVGFNSIDFDDELLRHAFYQNLKPAFVTTTHGNARADILGLCRVTATLRPDVLRPAVRADGRLTFRLAELASANGLVASGAHSAMADVMTTLTICRHIMTYASDVWANFTRFVTTASVDAFVASEAAFLYFSARPGSDEALVLMPLGPYADNPRRIHCLNLLGDFDRLGTLADEDLDAVLAARDRPVVPLRTNTAPIMTELFQACEEQLGGYTEAELLERAALVRSHDRLGPRLLERAQALQRQFLPATQVEDKLYGFDFPGRRDTERMSEFHASSWQRRAALVREFNDPRLQQLARRIVYFEDAALLPHIESGAMRRAISDRLTSGETQPWLTLAVARREMGELRSRLAAVGTHESAVLDAYECHLMIVESKHQPKAAVAESIVSLDSMESATSSTESPTLRMKP